MVGVCVSVGHTKKEIPGEGRQEWMDGERQRKRDAHVKAMDRMPPPAPARAWATLSFWGTTGLDCDMFNKLVLVMRMMMLLLLFVVVVMCKRGGGVVAETNGERPECIKSSPRGNKRGYRRLHQYYLSCEEGK